MPVRPGEPAVVVGGEEEGVLLRRGLTGVGPLRKYRPGHLIPWLPVKSFHVLLALCQNLPGPPERGGQPDDPSHWREIANAPRRFRKIDSRHLRELGRRDPTAAEMEALFQEHGDLVGSLLPGAGAMDAQLELVGLGQRRCVTLALGLVALHHLIAPRGAELCDRAWTQLVADCRRAGGGGFLRGDGRLKPAAWDFVGLPRDSGRELNGIRTTRDELNELACLDHEALFQLFEKRVLAVRPATGAEAITAGFARAWRMTDEQVEEEPLAGLLGTALRMLNA